MGMKPRPARKPLEKYLKEHGLNQEEFGKKIADVSQGMVSQWVQGIRPVTPVKALLIDKKTNGELSKHDLCPDVYPREESAA